MSDGGLKSGFGEVNEGDIPADTTLKMILFNEHQIFLRRRNEGASVLRNHYFLFKG